MKQLPSEIAWQILNKLKIEELKPRQRMESLQLVCKILSMDTRVGAGEPDPAPGQEDTTEKVVVETEPEEPLGLPQYLDSFLADMCLTGPAELVASTRLYDEFLGYLKKIGAEMPVPTQKTFGSEMKKRFDSDKKKGRFHYFGVGLKDERKQEAEAGLFSGQTQG